VLRDAPGIGFLIPEILRQRLDTLTRPLRRFAFSLGPEWQKEIFEFRPESITTSPGRSFSMRSKKSSPEYT